MALPGMRSSGDFANDERPTNYREGILLNTPRNKAPLYALTAMMRSESTDDPQFNWWEESEELFMLDLSGDIDNSDETIPLVSGGTKLKSGDLLYIKATGETVRVISITSDTSIEATRSFGSVAATAVDISVVGSGIFYIGSAYREGAGRPTGTAWNPSKKYNYTQIFRTPVEWTRTGSKTRTRTGDVMRNDRRRCLGKHSIGIEQAFWFGERIETTESGQPLRTTGGFLSWIDSDNIATVTAAGVDMDELEGYMPSIFSYGSGEKVAWCSVKTLMIVAQIVRKNSQYQWGPNEKEYNMAVKRLMTPAGTLTFMEHPLFGQPGHPLYEDMVIMDTADLVYRYLDDTKLLKDRQDKGVDGMAEEYLTEAGLEVHHANHHFWLKGFKAAAIDD